MVGHGQGPTSKGPQQKTEQQLQGVIYEEPVETAIPLSDNLAYGHVDMKRKNLAISVCNLTDLH